MPILPPKDIGFSTWRPLYSSARDGITPVGGAAGADEQSVASLKIVYNLNFLLLADSDTVRR